MGLSIREQSRFGRNFRLPLLVNIMGPMQVFALEASPSCRHYLTMKCLAYVGLWTRKLCPRSSPPLIKVQSGPLDKCHHVERGCPACNPSGWQPRSMFRSRDICHRPSVMTIHTPPSLSAASFSSHFVSLLLSQPAPQCPDLAVDCLFYSIYTSSLFLLPKI